MNPQQICATCGQPSSLLCDGRIAKIAGKEYRIAPTHIHARGFDTRSCDAPVCRACAKKIGDVHLKTNKGCRWDTRDLCPLCAAVPLGIPIEVNS